MIIGIYNLKNTVGNTYYNKNIIKSDTQIRQSVDKKKVNWPPNKK